MPLDLINLYRMNDSIVNFYKCILFYNTTNITGILRIKKAVYQ